MSFADERDPDPDPPVGAASAITVEAIGQGVEVAYARGGVTMMRVWVSRAVARRMESHLDEVLPPLLESAENVAACARVVGLFREVVIRGGSGGTVELPEDAPTSLLHRLLH